MSTPRKLLLLLAFGVAGGVSIAAYSLVGLRMIASLPGVVLSLLLPLAALAGIAVGLLWLARRDAAAQQVAAPVDQPLRRPSPRPARPMVPVDADATQVLPAIDAEGTQVLARWRP